MFYKQLLYKLMVLCWYGSKKYEPCWWPLESYTVKDSTLQFVFLIQILFLKLLCTIMINRIITLYCTHSQAIYLNCAVIIENIFRILLLKDVYYIYRSSILPKVQICSVCVISDIVVTKDLITKIIFWSLFGKIRIIWRKFLIKHLH